MGIGLISYGAYLWHQPLFAFARAITFGSPSGAMFVALIALTGVISYGSWRFVEMPIRRKTMMSTRCFVIGVIGLSVLIVGAGAIGHLEQGFPHRFDSFDSAQSRTMIQSPLREKCHTQGQDYIKPTSACRYFGNTVTWAVLGDSHGVELAYALGELLKDRQESIVHLTFSGCEPALNFESNSPGCTRWLREAVDMLQRDKAIRNIVLAYRHTYHLYGSQLRSFPDVKADHPNFLSNLPANKARDEYWNNFGEIVRKLSADRSVYLLEPVPELGSHIERLVYKKAINPAERRSDEIGSSLEYYVRRNRDVLDELRKYSTLENVKTIASSEALCDGRSCYAIRNGISLYFDDNHLSVEAAKALARKVLAIDSNP